MDGLIFIKFTNFELTSPRIFGAKTLENFLFRTFLPQNFKFPLGKKMSAVIPIPYREMLAAPVDISRAFVLVRARRGKRQPKIAARPEEREPSERRKNFPDLTEIARKSEPAVCGFQSFRSGGGHGWKSGFPVG